MEMLLRRRGRLKKTMMEIKDPAKKLKTEGSGGIKVNMGSSEGSGDSEARQVADKRSKDLARKDEKMSDREAENQSPRSRDESPRSSVKGRQEHHRIREHKGVDVSQS